MVRFCRVIKVTRKIAQSAREKLRPLSEGEMKAVLIDAANAYATPILEAHYEAVQGEPVGSPEYQERKLREYGSTENFKKTGRAEAAIHGPTEDRLVSVKKTGEHEYRAMVSLHREEDGVSIYAVAQRGGRGGNGPLMPISANAPGDVGVVVPAVKDSMVRVVKRRRS